jgi:hypothetical protein
VRKNTRPHIFWFNTIARNIDPAMLIGITSIRNTVFHKYF